jgi:anti-sigma factor ChrR (cupin superfamily)
MTHDSDVVHFDELLTLALADVATAGAPAPSPELRQRILSAISEPSIPAGFAFRFERDADWLPHPVPGIRMKVLALNRTGGYATLLLDVAPGARFPAHSHFGPEECYVISGSLYTCDRCRRRATSSTLTEVPSTASCGPMKGVACCWSCRRKTTCPIRLRHADDRFVPVG